jgi:hypothetical protein
MKRRRPRQRLSWVALRWGLEKMKVSPVSVLRRRGKVYPSDGNREDGMEPVALY